MWERVILMEEVVRSLRKTVIINMGFKKLLNLSTPSEPYEAATKEYVDDKDAGIKKEVNDVKKVIDERPVHTHYHGPLR